MHPNSDFLTWFILTAARSPTLREAAVDANHVLANRFDSRPKKSSFWPRVLTADLVAANRAPEKKLSVVPSLDLVVTRLGKLPGPAIQPTFPNGFWKRRMAPAPRSPENRSEASSEHRNTH